MSVKSYSYADAYAACIAYFNGDELATEVFLGKYALRNNNNDIVESTPVHMHKRLAREFARIESKYPNSLSEDEIYDLLSSWKIVPQGGPMAAIGNPYQVQSLSNCFVIESPYDSYGGILKTDQEQAQIMKRRGGVGFDISTIRPKGLKTANAARTTDGIGVFMERFSNTCREVAQGGRRGALMLSISVHCTEIRTFINIKRDLSKVTGANISIKLTDEFMRAVRDDKDVELRFPVETDATHVIKDTINARQLWNEIVESAWLTGEPGILFWDTVIRRSPADSYSSLGFKTTSTNPCGELPLAPADSCRLLLVNLEKFVINPYTQDAKFIFDEFANVVNKAQRLMDDMIDLELEAIDKIIAKINADSEPENVKRIEYDLWCEIKRKCEQGRRTGLGITALGDTIASLGYKYGSNESIEFTNNVYKTLCLSAYKSSSIMASERGAFPIYDALLEADNEFISHVLNNDDDLAKIHKKHGRRNIALLTTAPAGSVSILTQTTSGCEPVYKTSYTRRKKINPNDQQSRVDFIDQLGDKWQEYTVFHPGVKRWMDVTCNDDITKSPYHGSTSVDIDWLKKIELQAAAQRWVDHAISNTVNIPADTSIEVVKHVYERGWELGCKGITVYRDGTRDGVLVTAKQDDNKQQPIDIIETHAPKRPKELQCDIHRASVKGEQYLVLVGILNDKPYEIMAGLQEHVEVPKKSKHGTLIKNGKNKDGVATYNLKIPLGDDDELVFKDVVNLFDNPSHGALTRALSLSLRHGVPTQYIVEQLKKDKHSDLQSFSNVIGRVLKTYIKDGTTVTSEKLCCECGSTSLVYQQGCVSCSACGWSKC